MDTQHPEAQWLNAFAERVPGKSIIIWRGVRYTRLAEAVFERLASKMRIWAAALEKTPSSLRQEWADDFNIKYFLSVLRKKQLFLVEAPAADIYTGDTKGHDFHAYVSYDTVTASKGDPWCINFVFRESFLNPRNVATEESLFRALLHEIAHLFVGPEIVIRNNEAAKKVIKSDWSAEEMRRIAHPPEFYRAFRFNYNIAVRAGLILDAYETWRSDDDLVAWHNFRIYHELPTRIDAADLEFQLSREGAIARGPDDADDDASDVEDYLDIQSARYSALFSRYLGAPVDRDTIHRIVSHWRKRGQLDGFLNDVFKCSAPVGMCHRH
jgi:hypothetical protein